MRYVFLLVCVVFDRRLEREFDIARKEGMLLYAVAFAIGRDLGLR